MKNTIVLEQTIKVPAKKEKKQKEKSNRERRKPWLVVAFALSVTLVVVIAASVYMVVIPAQKVAKSFSNIVDTLSSLGADLEGKDLTRLDHYFDVIQSELDNINTEVERYDFLERFSFTKGYYANLQLVQKLSKQGRELIDVALPELKLTLEAMGYQVEGEVVEEASATDSEEGAEGETEESGNKEKIKALVRELPRIVALYSDVEPEILALITTFNELDPDYIPAIGAGDMKNKVLAAQNLTLEFPTVSAKIKDTMRVLPDLLGSEKPARYLLIFQNEKELRASGGLLSAFGNLVIDQGELKDDIVAIDAWDLQGYMWAIGRSPGYRNIYGQNVLMNRGCGGTELRAQDAGLYPDLHLTMHMFKDYYDLANRYNPRKYPEYDHIIIINTFFASDLVSFIEPLAIEGTGKTITSENLAKEIFAETSTASFDPAIRKEFIGEVATAAQEKFNELPTELLPEIGIGMIRTIQAKNIGFASKDPTVQAYFDEFGLSGRIETNFNGDYFHLNEAQNCALKANFYITNEVTQDIVINDSGKITKNINVVWKNEKVYDPNEKFILSDLDRFRYRAWVRVFAPQGTKFISTDGYKKSDYIYIPQTYFDQKMQKQISDNIIRFDHRRNTPSAPIKTHDLNVSYELPDSLNYSSEAGYRLLVQKHPGKRDERYVINIIHEGKNTSIDFHLDRDKVITYQDGILTIDDYDKRLDDYVDLMRRLSGDAST